MKNLIIVGSGLFGSICAFELSKKYKVRVFEQRQHIGGNCFTEKQYGINVHKYGAHIFHTKNKLVWQYINKFSDFNNYVHKVFSRIGENLYPIPFNQLTYQMVFGQKIFELTVEQKEILFEKFIKEYSEKQWGEKLNDIPLEIFQRLPIRYTLNNDYFENEYQGIPINGYTDIFERLLSECEIVVDKKFTLSDYSKYDKYIFTGMVDELFEYKFGKLGYRYLNFVEEYLPIKDFQGNSVINYPSKKVDFTRIIEHKHFEFNNCEGTIITKEFASNESGYPCYPINSKKNNEIYTKYVSFIKEYYPNIILGGRLGLYRYLNMDKIIELALTIKETLC